jgi:hypothetical protein
MPPKTPTLHRPIGSFGNIELRNVPSFSCADAPTRAATPAINNKNRFTISIIQTLTLTSDTGLSYLSGVVDYKTGKTARRLPHFPELLSIIFSLLF